MKILIFDTETTGKDKPRIVQLAYKRIRIQDMKCEAEKTMMFKPAVPIEIGAMAVHHITNEAVADMPPFTKNAAIVQKIVKECALVAHNAKFDVTVLRNEGIDVPVTHPVICTYKLAVHLHPELETHTLQYLRYALHIDRPEFHDLRAHDAMADVVILETLFNKFLWEMLLEGDPKAEITGDDIPRILKEMVKICSKPILYPKFKFGKWKGKTFEEVKLRDTSYFDWLLDSETRKPLEDQDENLVYTLKYHLKRTS